jgi:ComF family protein
VLISQAVSDHLQGKFDLISWVPVSRQRKRERGYDQCFLLAKELGRILEQEPVELLRKEKNIQPQSRLKDAAERRANVMGVYCVPWPERVRGKRVLLVDDVVTTGSTLSECARALLMAGAEDVVCVTLARAR